MSGKDGGWVLPTTIDPENRLCVQFQIPDDLYHIMAFWGALQELCYWFNWQRDDLKQGSEAANVWKQVIQDANILFNSENPCPGEEPCNPMIYDIRTVGCELQVQRTEGAAWAPVGDFSACGAIGPEGPAGPQGETGPTGPQGLPGVDGADAGDPDSEGGVPDPVAGPDVTDLKCAVATGVADKAVDMLLELLQQKQLQTVAAEVVLMAGAILISGPVGIVAATLGGAYGLWLVQDAEAAEQELTQVWRDEAKCRLYCNLGDDASIDRAVLTTWGVEMAAYSANAGAKLAEMLDGVAVSALRNEPNLAALTNGSCDDCMCGQHEFDVPADDADGIPTGLMVAAGASIVFACDAGDTWQLWTVGSVYNADGAVPVGYSENNLAPNLPGAAMIGRIGSGDWFLVGLSSTHEMTASGELILACNDQDHTNNSGSITVTVTLIS